MYDVAVIGGGPGGYAAAIRASQLGGKAVLVESAEIGGTCVNRGCIPSKVWLRAAYLFQAFKQGETFGIKAQGLEFDPALVTARKDGVAGDIRMGMEALLDNNGIEVVRGRARIAGSGRVDVEGRVLEAKKIVLATGSRLDWPDLPGLEEAAITTDQILEMNRIPESILIFGQAGPIEVEMAALLQALGCRVVLAADGSGLLPREDAETGQRLAQALREQGVEILTRSALEAVTADGSGFLASFAGSEKTASVEKVLVCGRRPNTDGLGLAESEVELTDDGGIRVDDRLETTCRGIYAVGDVTGGWMLSHAASAMAVTAAENAMGGAGRFPFHLVPRSIWTMPQVGSVGLSEEDADEKDLDYDVDSFPYAINGLAMARGEIAGSVKYVVDSRYGEILGVHIVGANATELIGHAVTAMMLEATPKELARSIQAHPSFSEAVVDAARAVEGWALYLPKR